MSERPNETDSKSVIQPCCIGGSTPPLSAKITFIKKDKFYGKLGGKFENHICPSWQSKKEQSSFSK